VVIADSIPIGATYVADSASSGNVLNGATLTWTIASLPAGGSGTAQFKAMVD